MPKYVYDPKLNTMVPQQKRGIDYALTGEGLRITDHDRKIEFVITRDNRCKLPARNIDFDCKKYDSNTARQIAGRVQRIYPQSKYKDWRFFAKGFNDPYDYDIEEQMTSEDKALLRSISESYGSEDVLNYINHLDEGHIVSVANAQSSHGQTPGTTQHGLKGLVNALPSAIISFLVCPPIAILGWLGAVHERSEKRWLKTRINPNRWLDFVATPWERQKKVRDKIAEEMAENTQYYYTRLANGEILRVVGCSTLEAKEMVMAIEHKDIIPRYKEWDDKLKLTDPNEDKSVAILPQEKNNYIMWVIKFSNGEACYAFGLPDASDKEDIMEKAIESRKAIVEYYRKIKYKDEDNNDRKVQRHGGIGKKNKSIFNGEDDKEMKKLFAIPTIDDMIKITNPSAYKIINDTNFKDFSTPQTSPLQWSPNGNVVYKFKIPNFAEFTLPLKKNVEAQTFCQAITELTSPFAMAVYELAKARTSSNAIYKVETGNHDTFIIAAGENPAQGEISKKTQKLTDAISNAIMENNLQNVTPISELTKKDYRTDYEKNNQITTQQQASTPVDDNGDLPIYPANWCQNIKYWRIDSKTREVLEGPMIYNSGKSDNNIAALSNTNTGQNVGQNAGQNNTQNNNQPATDSSANTYSKAE